MFQTRDGTANDFSSTLFIDFLLCMPQVPGPLPLRWFWLGSSDVLWFLKEPRSEWRCTCARQRTRSPRLWALPDSPPQRRVLPLTRSRPVQIPQLRPRRLHPKVQHRVSDRTLQRSTLEEKPWALAFMWMLSEINNPANPLLDEATVDRDDTGMGPSRLPSALKGPVLYHYSDVYFSSWTYVKKKITL